MFGVGAWAAPPASSLASSHAHARPAFLTPCQHLFQHLLLGEGVSVFLGGLRERMGRCHHYHSYVTFVFHLIVERANNNKKIIINYEILIYALDFVITDQ